MDAQLPNDRANATLSNWKSKLLDLTKRNRALNFKVNKVSTVTIIDELPVEIYRLLCAERKVLKFKPRDPMQPDLTESYEDPTVGDQSALPFDIPKTQPDLFQPYGNGRTPDRHTDDAIQTNALSDSLDNSLRRIDEQSRSIIEEQGVNALFLTLGMLDYRESKDSEIAFKAPLILVPVELVRKSAREGFAVKMTDEEIIVNPSLVEYLQRSYPIQLPDIDEDGSDDLAAFFEGVKEATAKQSGWKVSDEIYLGLFSFQKLVMYKDLERNTDKITDHRIFQMIINRRGEEREETFIALPDGIRKLDLDKYFAPEDCAQVVDADSSQLRAIATVSQNYDLVLEGPPGTGKSQTITNLIAHALSTGKKVLFVAEKMAALDVVYRRLCEIGLGEFCLELHSTKANKLSVMQELGKTWNLSLDPVEPSPIGTDRLPQVRSHLTQYANAAHSRFGALEKSPYAIFGELEKVISAPAIVFQSDISKVTSSELDDVIRNIDDLILVADETGPVKRHPWRDTTKTYYSPSDLDEIKLVGTSITQTLSQIDVEAVKLETILGLPKLQFLYDIENANEVASTIARSPGAPSWVLTSDAWNTAPPQSSALVDKVKKATELRHRIDQSFNSRVYDLDPNDEVSYVEAKSGGILSFLTFLDARYRSIRKRWLSLRLDSYVGSVIDQANDMRVVSAFIELQKELDSNGAVGTELFGELWHGEKSNWSDLQNYTNWVVEFRRLYIRKGLKEQAAETAASKSPDLGFVKLLRQNVHDLRGLISQLSELVGWPEKYFDSVELSEISSRVQALIDSIALASKWTAFELVRQKISDGFANEVLSWILDESIEFNDLPATFRRAFYEKWLSSVIKARPELLEFNSLTHEQRINEFARLDQTVLTQNQFKIVANLRKALQQDLQKLPSRFQMRTLQHELSKQRRIMPLRKLMQKCPDVIRSIKPCFMMSPQTVAQLLGSGFSNFDLVLFDEASQLPTEDAIGAIIRGDQLVVVGDPKQLPPTNFFSVASGQVNYEEDEDGFPLFEETESILEEVRSCGLPSSRLRWHYRSNHESLITFSNATFYDSDLFTFPSIETDSDGSGLHFEYIPDGLYEGKGLNSAEARRVAKAVVDHARSYPNVTLGVGTFNLRQQIAIQDELERLRREDPTLEPFFDRDKREPFFVKNLENIQGDERDVIFLSITYAKARDGRLRYNFGPLNGENGWRRMNVLITRSKQLMRVFSSIRADDINLTQTNSNGAKLLRDFLMFAENRRLDNPIVSSVNETDSPFEHQVYLELTRRGVSLTPQVGASGYRIDFGVIDEELSGRFVCGIECDGVSYHSSETARDRDRLRQQVLEERGWKIHRIWSTDWFKDREGQIERIIRLIGESRTQSQNINTFQIEDGEYSAAPEFVESEIDRAFDSLEQKPYVRPNIEEYEMAEIKIPSSYGDLLFSSNQELTNAVLEIVEQEAPIHMKDLFTRTASEWGTTAGSRIQRRIRMSVNQLISKGHIVMRGEFVWLQGGIIRVRSRTGTSIPADRIAPEEICELIKLVLQNGHKFKRQDLISEVRTLLGYNRTGAALNLAISNAIRLLLQAGMIGEGSTGIGSIR